MEELAHFQHLRKYLIFLSHVGNEFRGVQKQLPVVVKGKINVISTVQETLEDALQGIFKPLHAVQVHVSSRTDAGVHALRTSVHVRLQMQYDLRPDRITCELNKHFVAQNIGMRIQSTYNVPIWFSSRNHAIYRTYLYRLAFRKAPRPEHIYSKHLEQIPFSEYGRTLFVQIENMNIEKMQEAASLLTGTRDFKCFMGRPTKQPQDRTTIRTIYSLTMSPSKPFMGEHDPPSQEYNYWEIRCQGKSFLYRMVRRIVGVLLAVGSGDMDLSGVQKMLDKPEPESWNPRAICVPPYGLYLQDVEYNPLQMKGLDNLDEVDPDRPATLAL